MNSVPNDASVPATMQMAATEAQSRMGMPSNSVWRDGARE
jgi:hypothetical protein